MKDKFIALIDGNNFFAGCEILRTPSLKGKAVCVLSNNNGCIIARSNEAKEIGVKMGMPYFMAKKQFPQVICLSADFAFYRNLSQRMMKYLENYSDKIDVYSIDEAFIDVTGADKIFKTDYKSLAFKIKSDIEANVGTSVSAGIANSKTLAKIATHKAKSLNGFYFIDKDSIVNEIKGFPIEEIWGIGKNTARSLRADGIFYADEIIKREDGFFRTKYGKKGLELKYELAGISVIPLTGMQEKPKSIQRTRAFPEFSQDIGYIKAELELHLHSICKKLRKDNLKTNEAGVMLRTKDFRVFYRSINLAHPSNSELVLKPVILKLLNQIYAGSIFYRSSGIYAGKLETDYKMQLNLFQTFNYTKEESISNVMDKVELKYGKGSISLGLTGIKNIMKEHKYKEKLYPS